jgi:hypothetical protein
LPLPHKGACYKAIFGCFCLLKSLLFIKGKTMEQIIAELKELNKKVDIIVDIIKKPESKFFKLLEIIGNAVGIIGILAIVDIIRNWILGG